MGGFYEEEKVVGSTAGGTVSSPAKGRNGGGRGSGAGKGATPKQAAAPAAAAGGAASPAGVRPSGGKGGKGGKGGRPPAVTPPSGPTGNVAFAWSSYQDSPAAHSLPMPSFDAPTSSGRVAASPSAVAWRGERSSVDALFGGPPPDPAPVMLPAAAAPVAPVALVLPAVVAAAAPAPTASSWPAGQASGGMLVDPLTDHRMAAIAYWASQTGPIPAGLCSESDYSTILQMRQVRLQQQQQQMRLQQQQMQQMRLQQQHLQQQHLQQQHSVAMAALYQSRAIPPVPPTAQSSGVTGPVAPAWANGALPGAPAPAPVAPSPEAAGTPEAPSAGSTAPAPAAAAPATLDAALLTKGGWPAIGEAPAPAAVPSPRAAVTTMSFVPSRVKMRAT
jgi:TolA-binding protein